MNREPSDPRLDALFEKLRAESPPEQVEAVARALPARVAARLREEASAGGWLGLSCLRWTPALAGLAAACSVTALFGVRSSGLDALGDPQVAGLFLMLFG